MTTNYTAFQEIAPDEPPFPSVMTGQKLPGGIDPSIPVSDQLVFPSNLPYSRERQTEEQSAILPEIVLPFTFPAGQPPSGAPMVQGTPQISNVPHIQGAPSTPAGHAPAYVPPQHIAPASLPHAGEVAQTVQPTLPAHHPEQPPVHHPAQSPAHAPHQVDITKHPTGPLHPHKEPHHHEHEPEHHPEHTSQGRTHRLRTHHTHAPATHIATASKVAASTATKWLIVVMAAVVVTATSGVIFVLASSPALSLSGSSSAISAGGTLHIHGKGFLPGGSISLTLDGGLPVPVAFQPAERANGAGQHPALEADSLLAFDHLLNTAAANNAVSVSVTGSFDADVRALLSWSPGQHTIHATESLGSRSADLQFMLLPTPSLLFVNPTTLAFQVPMEGKVTQALEVANKGQSSLNWTATASAGTSWLSLSNNQGSIGFNGTAQFINVTADASHLKVGMYHATIQVKSNADSLQVAVTLQVLAGSSTKNAHLSVNPTSLNFGLLTPNQQITQSLTIGNTGTAPLTWKASAGGATWMTLSTSSGIIQAGATPQTIQVTVNTNGQTPGSYAAFLTITSNGGSSKVAVSFALPGSTPTPTTTQPPQQPTVTPTTQPTTVPTPTPTPTPTIQPTPSPTQPPTASWSVNPTSLSNSSSACSGSSSYSCTVTLAENSSSNTNITWSAKDSIGGVSFSPSGSTLTPGTSVTITISNIPCQSDTFTFTDNANVAGPLNVSWTCQSAQPPGGTASLGSCSYKAGTGWSCPLSIAANGNNQSTWNWSATSSGINGITVNPNSGSLSPGQSTTATAAIPDSICPASATITVSGGASNIPLSWSCAAPTIQAQVDPANCPGNSDTGWTCTDLISLVSGSQGMLSWTTSSDLPGVTFSPANGTLSVGQSIVITITVPSTDCMNGNFYFMGVGGNTATITWTCSS